VTHDTVVALAALGVAGQAIAAPLIHEAQSELCRRGTRKGGRARDAAPGISGRLAGSAAGAVAHVRLGVMLGEVGLLNVGGVHSTMSH
jgi:hypothetical protein